ncbi:MAG TPA: hypothetical protein VMW41_00360 [Candidatus Bathyarchaeia archaeon]|nr:hypothetical protein [Candidatus Bathyarchaeia archaeon]
MIMEESNELNNTGTSTPGDIRTQSTIRQPSPSQESNQPLTTAPLEEKEPKKRTNRSLVILFIILPVIVITIFNIRYYRSKEKNVKELEISPTPIIPSLIITPSPILTSPSVVPTEDWQTYDNPEEGITFLYPPNYRLIEPGRSVVRVGDGTSFFGIELVQKKCSDINLCPTISFRESERTDPEKDSKTALTEIKNLLIETDKEIEKVRDEMLAQLPAEQKAQYEKEIPRRESIKESKIGDFDVIIAENYFGSTTTFVYQTIYYFYSSGSIYELSAYFSINESQTVLPQPLSDGQEEKELLPLIFSTIKFSN